MTLFSVSWAARILCLISCISVAAAIEVTVCKDAPTFELPEVKVVPDPPAFGKDVTVSVTFNPGPPTAAMSRRSISL